MSKLLTVFGATGQQGGAFINYILQNPSLSKIYHLRGITRDTSKTSAIALKERGIEVIEADLYQPSTLLPAIAGSYAVFAVTNCEAPSSSIKYSYILTSNSSSLGESLSRDRNRTRESHRRRISRSRCNASDLVFSSKHNSYQ